MSEIIFDKIAAVISAKKGVNIELIKFESSFEELGLDSLDAVELIADLEEEFNVTIPNIDLQNIKSVKQAISSLEKAMQ
jgi:acyl carrier protein